MSDDSIACEIAQRVIQQCGVTFASEADIRLENESAALWQLLVLTQLLSARIRADAAVASARELWKIGCRTPHGLADTSWQQRVDALGRGGYRRYDFSTSTRLGKNAQLVVDTYDGDLRRVCAAGGGKPAAIAKLLQDFDGIGPAGASIFLREVQGVWPEVHPHIDKLVVSGAEKVDLPTGADELAALVPSQDFVRLAAGLVRIARGETLTDGG